MADPLHQFEIHAIGEPLFKVGSHEVYFTNQAQWMLIAVAAISILLWAGTRKMQSVPGRFQSVFEVLFEFIQDLVKDIAGSAGLKYLPYIFTLFLFVTVLNVFGMIPGSFTSTSQIAITGFMAVFIFSAIILVGLNKHGLKFFGLFLPSGTPIWLMPVMIPLEIVSFFIRPFTLAVRLGANMMAGHIALKVFAGFITSMLAAGGTLMIVGSALPFLGLFALTCLELMVALLQAYIFTLLTCVYLNDALHLH